jgi:hypothetical protein
MKGKEEDILFPNSLTIRRSRTSRGTQGEELGLFTTEIVEDKTVLGMSHIATFYYNKTTKKSEEMLLIKTQIGGFLQKSNNPNCKLVKSEDYDIWYLMTTRAVKRGEELTIDSSLSKLD